MANGIGIINGFDVSNKSPIDKRYGSYTGATLSECLSGVTYSGYTTYIPSLFRYEGLTVGIKVTGSDIVDYWFKGGITDDKLVLKSQDLSDYITIDTDQNISGVKVFDKAYVDTARILTVPTYTTNYTLKTITLGPLDAIIFSQPQGEGTLQLYTVPAATLTMPGTEDGYKNAVYVDYNGGSPIYTITATSDIINSSDKVFVGEVYGFDGQIYFIPELTQYRWGSTRYMNPISSTIGGDVWSANGALVFGENAGNINTKGQNTIVGDNSSQNLVNGIRNTIVGNQSFESNTTINNSTVIGYRANATENSYNAVAIGAESEAGYEAIQIGKGSNTESNTVQFGGTGGVNPFPINKFKVQTSTTNRDLISDIDGKSNLVDGNTFTGNQIINGITGNTLTINNTGTGNCIVVEDETSPDTTPTVIDNKGWICVGGTVPSGQLHLTADLSTTGNGQFWFDGYNSAGSTNTGPTFIARASRGTSSATRRILNGDVLFANGSRGSFAPDNTTSASWMGTAATRIVSIATGDFTSGSCPARIDFECMPSTSNTTRELAMSVSSNGINTSKQFISTLPTGTPPLTVASSTKVANLNADLLDGITKQQLLNLIYAAL